MLRIRRGLNKAIFALCGYKQALRNATETWVMPESII